METPDTTGKPPPLILASSSPYRREILERLGLGFTSRSPDIDESSRHGESPEALVRRLAASKARAVADGLADGLVIGSDQVAVLEGRILGKPVDHDDAAAQLRAASGKAAVLFSAVALLHITCGRLQTAVERVEVEYRAYSDDEIRRYLEMDRPYDCCGSVKVEGMGISLLSRISSDDPNAITGLPVIRLLAMLRSEGLTLP
jgi:MAF protein